MCCQFEKRLRSRQRRNPFEKRKTFSVNPHFHQSGSAFQFECFFALAATGPIKPIFLFRYFKYEL